MEHNTRSFPLMSTRQSWSEFSSPSWLDCRFATGPVTRASAAATGRAPGHLAPLLGSPLFVWLPRHPFYEGVEIMSIDTVGNPYRAVWVFFTERDGGKRQVHFFDDRRIVEGFAGSYYRPIDYERSGTPGRGQSVRVSLTRTR